MLVFPGIFTLLINPKNLPCGFLKFPKFTEYPGISFEYIKLTIVMG